MSDENPSDEPNGSRAPEIGVHEIIPVSLAEIDGGKCLTELDRLVQIIGKDVTTRPSVEKVRRIQCVIEVDSNLIFTWGAKPVFPMTQGGETAATIHRKRSGATQIVLKLDL